MQKIEFLGFMVTPTGISMDMAKTDTVSVWPTLTNLKVVQAFLGFSNFYPRFIVGFSNIIIPLIHFTRKDTPFAWGLITPRCSKPQNSLYPGTHLGAFQP